MLSFFRVLCFRPVCVAGEDANGDSWMNDNTTVFVVEHVDEVVIVEPLGDESSFRYFDIHNQANRVMRALDDPSVRGVVVDLRSVPTLGWVMTSAIVRLVRNLDYRGGLAVYCSASQANVDQFSSMKLGEPWTHHDSRDDGVAVIRELIAGRSSTPDEGT